VKLELRQNLPGSTVANFQQIESRQRD